MLGQTFEMFGEATLATGVRVFTPPQANRALVLVRRVVAELVDSYHRMLDLQETADALGAEAEVERKLADVSERLRSCIDELEAIGVELRDFARGIIDFPCVADGRVVYLCWRLGERGVQHWHELGESYVQRRPLGTLKGVAAPQPQAVPVG